MSKKKKFDFNHVLCLKLQRIKKIDEEIAILMKEKLDVVGELDKSRQKLAMKEEAIKQLDVSKLMAIAFSMYTTVSNFMNQCVDEEIRLVENALILSLNEAAKKLQAASEKTLKTKLAVDQACLILDNNQFTKPRQEIACHAEELVYIRNSLRTFMLLLNQNSLLSTRKKSFIDRVSEKVVEVISLCDKFCKLFSNEISNTHALTIFHSDKHMQHCTGSHPECANRLVWVMNGLKSSFPPATVAQTCWEGVIYKETTHMANKYL